MIINIKKPITPDKTKKAFAKLPKNNANKCFDAAKYAGKLTGVFGDPLAYQKAVRDEWE